MIRFICLPLICLHVLLSCLCSFAHAGSFSIDPVRITLSEARPSAVLRVENRGDTSTTVQLQAMGWSQDGEQEQLTVSRDLLATPQVFRLRPGQVQVVRIALLRPVDDSRELAYRLLLDEVPPPPAADFRGLQVALRVSMPVFIQPRVAAAAALIATVEARDGQRHLTLHNRGHAHLQLTGLSLQAFVESAQSGVDVRGLSAPAQTLFQHEKTVYLLAGQRRDIVLPADAEWPAKAAMRLQARTPDGEQAWPVNAIRR